MTVDVWIPIQIRRDSERFSKASDLLDAEWTRLFGDNQATYVFHLADAPEMVRISYWAVRIKDDLITEFFRGVCAVLIEGAE